MFNLYFKDHYGARRFLRQIESEDAIVSAIYEETAKINDKYKIYYVRSWKNCNGERTYDVGSHSEFFIAVEV